MDAAIYARLSKNRRRLSDNVAIQVAESQGYSEDKCWSVVLVCSDDDISASKFSTESRPGYEQLVAAIEAGQVEVIICTEMSRLYRRMEELLDLIRMAEHTRLRGIWTTDDDGYDLSTPEGIHRAIGAVNNAMLESAKLSRRQKRKKAAQARQGIPSGGGRPFGYEPDGITLRQSEVALLVEAKDRYLAGETIRDIVRDFYRRGVVSPYGKPWQIENFQRVLFSKRYLGIRVHNGAEYPAVWPAIFTTAEWDSMMGRRMVRAAKWPGRGRGVGRTYLLTGLLYCNCGQYMIGSKTKRRDQLLRRYRCRHYDNYGQLVGCGKVFRMAEPLELFVTEAVLYRLDSPAVAAALSQTGDSSLDEFIAEFQAAKGRLDQMTTDYASGFLSRDEYSVAKRVAERNVETAKETLARLDSRKTGPIPAPDQIREAWDTAGLDWRHSIISLLVEKIVCLPGHPGSHEWRGWRFQPDFVQIVWRV